MNKLWIKITIIASVIIGMGIVVLQNDSTLGLVGKLRIDKVYRVLFVDKKDEGEKLKKKIIESDLIIIGRINLMYCLGTCWHEVEVEKILFGKTEKKQLHVASEPDVIPLGGKGIQHSLSIDYDKPKAAKVRCIIFLKKSKYSNSTSEDRFFIRDYDSDYQFVELLAPEILVKIKSTLNN